MKELLIDNASTVQSYSMPLLAKTAFVISIALTVIAALGMAYFGMTAGINTLAFYCSAGSIAPPLLLTLAIAIYFKYKSSSNPSVIANNQGLDLKRPIQQSGQNNSMTSTIHTSGTQLVVSTMPKVFLSVNNSKLNAQILPFDSSLVYKIFKFEDGNLLVMNNDSFKKIQNEIPFIEKLFVHGTIESNQSIVDIHDIERSVFLELINDIENPIELNENILIKYRFAHVWGCQNLERQYYQLIVSNLSQFSNQSLISACTDFSEFSQLVSNYFASAYNNKPVPVDN